MANNICSVNGTHDYKADGPRSYKCVHCNDIIYRNRYNKIYGDGSVTAPAPAAPALVVAAEKAPVKPNPIVEAIDKVIADDSILHPDDEYMTQMKALPHHDKHGNFHPLDDEALKDAVSDTKVYGHENGYTFNPDVDKNFWIEKGMLEELERVIKLNTLHGQNVLLVGLQGCGKTTIPIQLAAKYHKAVYVANCGAMTTADQWFGSAEVKNHETAFRTSGFLKAIQTPNTFVVLDDWGRVENPKVLNPLFGFLDDRREAYCEELGQTIKVAPGVMFFATYNVGAGFTGSDPVDVALKDRFRVIKVNYPNEKIEAELISAKTGLEIEKAEKICSFASKKFRSDPNLPNLSTRQLLYWAESVKAGASFRDGLSYSCLWSEDISDDMIRGILMALQQETGEMAAGNDWVKLV
ncbi:MAG: AAA family ATPase [Deltaproteobacteria bacterium]|nr:AAA family ATPase [Deltaproteobacteria bacterium]